MGLFVDDRWKTFNMLAIDPGKNHLGTSIHELDSRTGEYRSIEIETIHLHRVFRRRSTDEDYTSVTDACLTKIQDHIEDLVDHYNIAFFAYESPFHNKFRPGAYGPLCEVVSACRMAVIHANPFVFIDSMSPQNIKKGVGAGGTKGKEIMHEKVTANKELMGVLKCPIEDLTEHCIDSIAIGYNARKTILAPMEGWRL